MAFTTTSDLAQFAEKELGHNLDGASSQRSDIISHLDRAHKIVLAGGGILNYTETSRGPRRKRSEVDFLWARSASPIIVNTVAPYDDGSFTASCTNGSTTVELSSDPSSGSDLSNYHIRIGSDLEVYKISSNSTTTLTLESAYVGTTNATASAKVFKLQYDFGSSNILKWLGPIRVDSKNRNDKTIEIVDRQELLDQYPLSSVDKEFPVMAGVVSYSSGTLTLQFNDYTKDTERFVLDYIAIPSTLVESSVDPIIPEQYCLCLGYLAAYYMLKRNDDDRAKAALSDARDIFDELVDYNKEMLEQGDNDYGRVVPNLVGDARSRVQVERDYD